LKEDEILITKRIKVNISNDKKIVIQVPDFPSGEAKIIILKKEKKSMKDKDILSQIPRHKAGKVLSTMRREHIYLNAR